jgi:tRNA (Thr-GGU) A37 N-methylase
VPCRPNPIGLSGVRLLGISGGVLQVEGLDILDNTPLLDIKPYIPAFDAFEAKRMGWGENAKAGFVAADGRFESGRSG